MAFAAGDALPDLTLLTDAGEALSLREAAGGSKLVLYFYPKDSTPGCTLEGQDFTRLLPAFEAAKAVVFGVSRDSAKSHARFAEKCGIGLTLLADTDGAACAAFGTWIEKSLYGRKYLGIDRSTWLFDADGKLVQSWRQVKVKGHAEAVLAAAQAL